MFQIRYVLFIGSKPCIPDYNSKHDYITYDTLYDNGRSTYSRSLPSCHENYLSKLPPVDKVVNIFRRAPNR